MVTDLIDCAITHIGDGIIKSVKRKNQSVLIVAMAASAAITNWIGTLNEHRSFSVRQKCVPLQTKGWQFSQSIDTSKIINHLKKIHFHRNQFNNVVHAAFSDLSLKSQIYRCVNLLRPFFYRFIELRYELTKIFCENLELNGAQPHINFDTQPFNLMTMTNHSLFSILENHFMPFTNR